MNNCILASKSNDLLASKTLKNAKQNIEQYGWTLLRGFDMNTERFSQLLHQFCQTLTFDPARQSIDGTSQKVDAGTHSVGLHIENGNTPFPPKMVAFYSAKSAMAGSQTTICDGLELFNIMPEKLQQQWQQPITVKRQLPSHLWRQYVVDQHPQVTKPEEVTMQHLEDLIAINNQQRGIVNEDDCLDYELDISPCLPVTQQNTNKLAFANALLGPSFNYQKPSYTFNNGEQVSDDLLQETAKYAEQCTHEVQWQNGDVVLINNHRVLHGRRDILGSLNERVLYIGMGS